MIVKTIQRVLIWIKILNFLLIIATYTTFQINIVLLTKCNPSTQTASHTDGLNCSKTLLTVLVFLHCCDDTKCVQQEMTNAHFLKCTSAQKQRLLNCFEHVNYIKSKNPEKIYGRLQTKLLKVHTF